MTDINSKVPARYIGPHPVVLGAFGGPYYDAAGRPLASLYLAYGDTLMMPEGEIRGETYIVTTQGAEYLGTGKVVKEEHAGLSASTLADLGYQFHQGRPDFAEIVSELAAAPEPEPEPAPEVEAAPFQEEGV